MTDTTRDHEAKGVELIADLKRLQPAGDRPMIPTASGDGYGAGFIAGWRAAWIAASFAFRRR